MWLKLLGAVLAGGFMYVMASLLFNNIITGTSQSAVFTQSVVPPVIGAVTVGISAMGLFNHS